MATFLITVADKTYKVEIDEVTSPATVRVDGEPFTVKWEREQPATAAAAAPAAPVAPSPVASTAVASTPKPQPVAAPKPAAIAPSGKGELVEITAPLPGKILKVAVQPGDKVKFGQQVCTLEAMKMESAIQSNFDGTVVAVRVSPGQNVQYGDVLVVVEKQGA